MKSKKLSYRVGGVVMALHELFDDAGFLRGFQAVVNVPPAPGKTSWRRRKKGFRLVDFPSRADASLAAEKWTLDQKLALRRGSWIDPSRSKLHLEVYADQVWDLAMQGLRANVRRNYDLAWRNNIIPVIGRVPVGQINRGHIEQIKAPMLAADSAPSTVNGVVSALSRILRYALDENVITANPAAAKGSRVREVRSARRVRETVSPAGVEQLARECDQRVIGYGEPVRVAFWTGARAEEIWAMKVGDIDLKRRRISIERAWSGTNAKGRILEDPKSGKGRTVPILDQSVALFTRLTDQRAPGEWLFQGARGQAIWHQNYREKVDWPRAAISAGFPAFRFHDLRHSHATYLLDQGVPVHTVSAILGHKSIATTQIYLHANDHGLEVAIESCR